MILLDSWAEISSDDRFRYSLGRRFMGATYPGYVLFVGFNPSTAAANVDDPTVKRMMHFTHRWGYGEMRIVNPIPLRTSDPEEALRWWDREIIASRIFGHLTRECYHNADVIDTEAQGAAMIVPCWGNAGGNVISAKLFGATEAALRKIRPLHVFGLTKGAKQPIHPMARGRGRLPDDTQPQIWSKP